MIIRRHKEGLIARKMIHYSAVFIPLSYYYFFDKSMMIYILLATSFVVVFSDILRMSDPRNKKLYWKLFGWMTKKEELQEEFTGASYLLIASLLVVMLFPKNIAVVSLIYLTIGDPTACLIGVFFGKKIIFCSKTLEGTLAFIFSGFTVSLLITEIPLLYKVITAIIAGIVEVFSFKIDDNFTIPIISGITLYAISIIHNLL